MHGSLVWIINLYKHLVCPPPPPPLPASPMKVHLSALVQETNSSASCSVLYYLYFHLYFYLYLYLYLYFYLYLCLSFLLYLYLCLYLKVHLSVLVQETNSSVRSSPALQTHSHHSQKKKVYFNCASWSKKIMKTSIYCKIKFANIAL